MKVKVKECKNAGATNGTDMELRITKRVLIRELRTGQRVKDASELVAEQGHRLLGMDY